MRSFSLKRKPEKEENNERESYQAKQTYEPPNHYCVKKSKKNIVRIKLPDLNKGDFCEKSQPTKSNSKNTIKVKKKKPIVNVPDFDLNLRFGLELLPLTFFDNSKLEKVNLDLIKEQLKSNIKLIGSSLIRKGDKTYWSPVLIHDISPDNKTFYVEFINEKIMKFVSRLNLIFSTEDREAFFIRRNKAEKYRESFMRMERYSSYLEVTLNPNDSFFKGDDFRRFFLQINKKLITNYELVAKIIREVCLLDVLCLHKIKYINDITSNKELAAELYKRNFPNEKDFPPIFICYPKLINLNISIDQRVNQLVSSTDLFKPDRTMVLLKIRQEAKSIANHNYIFFDESIDDICEFCVKTQDYIKKSITEYFLKSIDKIKEIVGKTSFINKNHIKVIDKIIVDSITEVSIKISEEFLKFIETKTNPFFKKITSNSALNLHNEYLTIQNTISYIEHCWSNASIKTISSLFSDNITFYVPDEERTSEPILKLRFFIDTNILPYFNKINDALHEFDEKFEHIFSFNFYESEKIIQDFDYDTASSIFNFSYNSIIPNEILTKEMLNDILEIKSIIRKLLNSILDVESVIYTPFIKVSFSELVAKTRRSFISSDLWICLKLFNHGMSFIEQQNAKIVEMRRSLKLEPNDLDTLIILNKNYKDAYKKTEIIKSNIKIIERITDEMSDSSFPFAFKMQDFLFNMNLRLNLFERSLKLRLIEINEARIVIKHEYEQKENNVLSINNSLELSLSILLNQGFTNSTQLVYNQTKELASKYKEIEYQIKEIKKGDIPLHRQSIYENKINENSFIAQNLKKMWKNICIFLDNNKIIASKQIMNIDFKEFSEFFSKLKLNIEEARNNLSSYPIPTKTCEVIIDSIYNFNLYFPIIKAIGSSYLKPRHIQEINKIFEKDVHIDKTVSLFYLVDINVLEKEKEILEISNRAYHEYILQEKIESMINSFNEIRFSFSLGTLNSFIKESNKNLKEQYTCLHEIYSSPYKDIFISQIKKHEKSVNKMNDLLSTLDRIYESYQYQIDFMEAEDTESHEINFFNTFKLLKDSVIDIVSKMNNYFSSISYSEQLTSIYYRLEDLRKNINEYLQKRRYEYYRLNFISNYQFFDLIVSSKSPELFSKKVSYVFPHVTDLIIDKYHIQGIIGENNEVLKFEPIPYLAEDIPKLLEAIESSIRYSLVNKIEKFGHRTINYFIENIKEATYQVILIVLNIKFTEQIERVKTEIEFKKLKNRFAELRGKVINIVKNKAMEGPLNSLFDYFEAVMKEMKTINNWCETTNINRISLQAKSENVFDFNNISSKVDAQDSRISIEQSQSFKKNDMFLLSKDSLIISQDFSDVSTTYSETIKTLQKSSSTNNISLSSIDSHIFTSSIKYPSFIKYKFDDNILTVSFSQYTYDYEYEFISNNFNMPNYDRFRFIVSFFEAISYNNACALITDSLFADTFAVTIASLIGRYYFATQASSNYFSTGLVNYIEALTCKNVLVHFETFNSAKMSVQNSISTNELLIKNACEGILVVSDCNINPIHFTFLRPVYFDEKVEWKLNCIIGANTSRNIEEARKMPEYKTKKIIDVVYDSVLQNLDITNCILWFHRRANFSDVSLYARNPYLELSNGTRINVDSSVSFMFETPLKNYIEKSMIEHLNIIEYRLLHNDIWDLYTVLDNNIVNFFFTQSEKLAPTNDMFIPCLAALCTSYSKVECERINKALKITTNTLNLNDLVLGSLNKGKSIIVFGNERMILIRWLLTFISTIYQNKILVFDPKESTQQNICVLIDFEDYEKLNQNYKYIIINSDASKLNFECGCLFQFIPGSIIQQSKAIDFNSIDKAVEYYKTSKDNIAIFSNIRSLTLEKADVVSKESEIIDVIIKNVLKISKTNESAFITVNYPTFKLPTIKELNKIAENHSNVLTQKKFFESLLQIKFIFVSSVPKKLISLYVPDIFKACSVFYDQPENNYDDIVIKNFSFATELASKVYKGKAYINSLECTKKYSRDLKEYLKVKIIADINRHKNILDNISKIRDYEEQTKDEINKLIKVITEIKEEIYNSKKEIENKILELKEAKIFREKEFKRIEPDHLIEINVYNDLTDKINNTMPSINEATNFMTNFDNSAVLMIKAIKSPTPSVLPIFECYSILFDIKPKIDRSTNTVDYFVPMQKVVQGAGFILSLYEFIEKQTPLRKIKKIEKTLNMYKEILNRAGKTSPDITNLTKWFKMLCQLNIKRESIAPLIVDQEKSQNKLREIEEYYDKLDNDVLGLERKYLDLLEKKEILIKEKKAKQKEKEEKEMLYLKIYKMNTFLNDKTTHMKEHLNYITIFNENLDDICFTKSIINNIFCGMVYSQHNNYRSYLFSKITKVDTNNPYFDRNLLIKLRMMGVLNDDIVLEKVMAVLDPIRVPIILDPNGFALFMLKTVFSEAQIVSSSKCYYNMIDPVILLTNDIKEMIKFIGQSFPVFIITDVQLYQIPIEFQSKTTYVNFNSINYSFAFQQFVVFNKARKVFNELAKQEEDLSKNKEMYLCISENMGDAFNQSNEEFFTHDIVDSFKTAIAETYTKICKEKKRINELSNLVNSIASQENSVGNEYNEMFSRINNLMKMEATPFFHLFTEFCNNSNGINELTHICESALKLSLDNSFDSIDENDYSLLFNSIEGFRIDYSSGFSFKEMLANFPSDIPLVIRTKYEEDPTSLILSSFQGNNSNSVHLNIQDEYDPKVYMHNGIMLFRFPEYVENGFAKLSIFVSKLLTKHTFTIDFRLIILIGKSFPIPSYFQHIAHVVNWPPVAPPSFTAKTYDNENASFSQLNLAILYGGLLSPFTRPTLAIDYMYENKFPISKVGLAFKLPNIVAANVDHLWFSSQMTMKKNEKEYKRKDMSLFKEKEVIISTRNIENSFQVYNLYSLDFSIDNETGEVIKRNVIYPTVLDTVWVMLADETYETTLFDSVVYNSSDKTSVRALFIGYHKFHFIY